MNRCSEKTVRSQQATTATTFAPTTRRCSCWIYRHQNSITEPRMKTTYEPAFRLSDGAITGDRSLLRQVFALDAEPRENRTASIAPSVFDMTALGK